MPRIPRPPAVTDEERLALLRVATQTIRDNIDVISLKARQTPHPFDMHVELVQEGLLSREDFDRLYCRGAYERRYSMRTRFRNPQDYEAYLRVRRLQKELHTEQWKEVDEGRRPHPLNRFPRR